MAGRRHNPKGYGDVVAAALLVHVGRSQVDDNFFARHVVAKGLEGCHRAQEALLDGGVGKAYQVKAYSKGDIYLNGDRHGPYADALCGMYIYQHTILL